MNTIRKIRHFLNKLESKVRSKLSHHPVWYAIIGGVGVVLFWRGVWHLADDFQMGSLVSVVIGLIILLVTGVLVSAFIGNRLIISGLLGEKKITEKTKEELEAEENRLRKMQDSLKEMEKQVAHLEEDMHGKK